MLQLGNLWAQGGGGGTAGPFDPSILVLLVGVPFLMYFLLIRPQRKMERERLALLSSLKKNDKILTNSGMYGTVVEVSDKEDEVTIKIADNVRVKMIKSSIARNLSNEEEAAKAAKAKKEGGEAAAKT
jgi:preprotein translocase subunit YajC